jgi:hypothetical protein
VADRSETPTMARRPGTVIEPQHPARYCPRCRTAHADNEPHRDERVTPVDFQTAIEQASSELSTVMAEVNGDPIYEHEVVASLERRGIHDRSIATMRSELYRCIDQRLVCQDARRNGFTARAVQQAGYYDEASAAPDDAALAAQWLATRAPARTDVSRSEVFAHYRARLDQFQPPAEVRWERMSAPLERFGSRQNAEAAIGALRDRAQGINSPLPRGVELRRVVTESHDWTRKDHAPTPELAHWLYVLPVGTISPLLSDEGSVFVVRVVERRQGRAITLEQAAPHIERDIVANRRAAAEGAYIAGLRREARVWTLFEDQPAPAAAALP